MIYIIREEFLIFINTFFYQKNSKDIFMRKIKYNKKKKGQINMKYYYFYYYIYYYCNINFYDINGVEIKLKMILKLKK